MSDLAALRDGIPIIETLREMQDYYGFKVHPTMTKVHCRVFEDNLGALEMAKIHKSRPRTKHINAKLHHFRSYVGKYISIHKIGTDDQPADIFTKSLTYHVFVKHRNTLMGWSTIIQLQRPVTQTSKRECKILSVRQKPRKKRIGRDVTREVKADNKGLISLS
jgi:hypothetical protein